MKKAGIITHYDVHNHGAHLQLYALIQVLRELGYDAKALRYQKNYDFMGGAEAAKKYNISIRSIPTYLKYAASNGVDRTLYNYHKRKVLARFRREHDLLGDYYSEASGLDAVVIGSDEIFSVEAGPNPWYYGIGVPCDYQISYAASFGPTTLELIDSHNMGGMVEAGIRQLRHVAVRDQNSANIVKHYLGREPAIVCDPVLLYQFKDQLKREAIDAFRKEHPEKYCLVYSYDYHMNERLTVDSIKAFAKKRGLKVYSIAYFHRWCDQNINPDPLDVLKWFFGAEMVFTDTFHGSVISFATHTQFVSKIRGNGNKLSFLLDQYGVADRKVDDFSQLEAIAKRPIDYGEAEKTILQIRQTSFDYLKAALG